MKKKVAGNCQSELAKAKREIDRLKGKPTPKVRDAAFPKRNLSPVRNPKGRG